MIWYVNHIPFNYQIIAHFIDSNVNDVEIASRDGSMVLIRLYLFGLQSFEELVHFSL